MSLLNTNHNTGGVKLTRVANTAAWQCPVDGCRTGYTCEERSKHNYRKLLVARDAHRAEKHPGITKKQWTSLSMKRAFGGAKRRQQRDVGMNSARLRGMVIKKAAKKTAHNLVHYYHPRWDESRDQLELHTSWVCDKCKLMVKNARLDDTVELECTPIEHKRRFITERQLKDVRRRVKAAPQKRLGGFTKDEANKVIDIAMKVTLSDTAATLNEVQA
jgi:hypothetical protein